MARIQILELPEGASDERPPFALIIDEYAPQPYILGADQDPLPSPFEGVAEEIGARTVLVFTETVEIPANQVTLEDGHTVRVQLEADTSRFEQQLEHVKRMAEQTARPAT